MTKEVYVIKKKTWIIPLVLALATSIVSVIIKGISINSQTISGFTTLSVGFPFTFFEFYYHDGVAPTFSYILQNIDKSNFKFDVLIFLLDTVCFYCLYAWIQKKILPIFKKLK